VLLTERGSALDLPRICDPPGLITSVSSWSDVVTLDPELLGGGGPSRSSDVWALGATLNAVLGDRPLYPGIEADDPVTAVQRILFTRPEPDPSLAPAVRDLISRCLAADPADRPPTALAVAEDLTSIGTTR
jgi:serine/threonine protein kinase